MLISRINGYRSTGQALGKRFRWKEVILGQACWLMHRVLARVRPRRPSGLHSSHNQPVRYLFGVHSGESQSLNTQAHRGNTIRKFLAAIFAAAILFTSLSFAPAQADTLDGEYRNSNATLNLVHEESYLCEYEHSTSYLQNPECFTLSIYSTRMHPVEDAINARQGSITSTLRNLSTGKTVALDGNYGWGSKRALKTEVRLENPILPHGKYELTIKFDFPAGSICQTLYWCTPVPRYAETRYHEFTWKGRDLTAGQLYKSTSTKQATATASYTSTKSASYTGKASYTVTATATYKSKGKTYTAKASQTVTKTTKVTKSAKSTVKNVKKTGTATRSSTSTVSQEAANQAASSSATAAATKTATTAASKSARSSADDHASTAARKLLTTKVKNAANVSAKAKITKSVKAIALKDAKAKALVAAKKKAK